MKSEVQLIKDEFVLVSLKGHLAGQFAYVPVRQVSLHQLPCYCTSLILSLLPKMYMNELNTFILNVGFEDSFQCLRDFVTPFC